MTKNRQKLYWRRGPLTLIASTFDRDFGKRCAPPRGMVALARAILSRGGNVVVFMTDEAHDANRIMPDTRQRVRLLRGRHNECHDNVARLATAHPTWQPRTGFALSPDGIWRWHSWLLNRNSIIETTVERTAYLALEIG